MGPRSGYLAGNKVQYITRKSLIKSLPSVFEGALHRTVRSFGIRRNEKMAVRFKVCGAKVEVILKRGLKVREWEVYKIR